MRKHAAKFRLHRETLRYLAPENLTIAGGYYVTENPACHSQSACNTLCTICVSCHGGTTCL